MALIGLAKLAPGPGNVALAERPQPSAAPGQVVLEVHGTGVCGTDLHIEASEYPSVPPVTMGHEISGMVVELGAGVDSAWQGARVVCETFFSTCRQCRWCRDGRPNLCPERQSIGTHVDGGFARRVVVPATNLHRVPGWLRDHAAALAEPLACVCQCMFEPTVAAPGDRALIVGPGPMGVLAAQVARALGADVTLRGLPADVERLAIAGTLGLSITSDDSEATEFDLAVDASGNAAGAAACLDALRRGGRYGQIGIFGRSVNVPLDLLLEREIEVSAGFASTPRAWRRALQLLERGDVELEPLVSEVTPLSDWERVFADLRAKRQMKVVFDPRL